MIRLSEAVADYLATKEARGDSADHRKECARVLALLCEQLGDVPVERIEADELREFMVAVRSKTARRGRRVSDHTIKTCHRTLAAFFRYCYDEGWMRPNPMARVPKPKFPQELVKPFSEDEIRKLLATPNTANFSALRDVGLMALPSISEPGFRRS